MVISSEAPIEENVQRLEHSSYTSSGVEARDTLRGDDIVRSSGKSEAACYLYKITNTINNKVYVGITNNLRLRWNAHKFSSTHSSLPLYCAMRKYGVESFTIIPICIGSREYILDLEVKVIALLNNLYNVAPGGEGGFNVTDKESWKEKLKKARVGYKPALGMCHSENNKRLFSEKATKYWSDKKYPVNITLMSFKEANNLYGISKTHYYRLKRASIND